MLKFARLDAKNTQNLDFCTKIRLFSDHLLTKSLNSDFCRKFGPEWEAWIYAECVSTDFTIKIDADFAHSCMKIETINMTIRIHEKN